MGEWMEREREICRISIYNWRKACVRRTGLKLNKIFQMNVWSIHIILHSHKHCILLFGSALKQLNVDPVFTQTGRVSTALKIARFGISTHNPRPYFSLLTPYFLIMFFRPYFTLKVYIEIDFLLLSQKALYRSQKFKILAPPMPWISCEAKNQSPSL